jgi:hypothetical protein
MTLEKMQYTARLRATHENVLSRTRRCFPAVPAVGGTLLLLLLAAASYAQTVRTVDAQAFVASPLPDQQSAATKSIRLSASMFRTSNSLISANVWRRHGGLIRGK